MLVWHLTPTCLLLLFFYKCLSVCSFTACLCICLLVLHLWVCFFLFFLVCRFAILLSLCICLLVWHFWVCLFFVTGLYICYFAACLYMFVSLTYICLFDTMFLCYLQICMSHCYIAMSDTILPSTSYNHCSISTVRFVFMSVISFMDTVWLLKAQSSRP